MMSSADLLEDGFPHGTPEGYDQGCRSAGGCPTGHEYGLSCKIAKTKSRSDYQYSKLVKSGASIAEIADALGLIGTAPTAAPVAKKKPAKPEHDAWSTPSIPATVPIPVIAATTITPDAVDEPTPEAARPETPTKQIRAWARDRGYEVPSRGTLRQEIIDHYWEAHGHGATTPADQAPVNKPEPQEDAAEAPIDPVDEAQDQPPVNEPQREDRPDYGTMNLENDLAEAIAQRDQARAFAANYWDELERTKQLLDTEREQHAASVRRADATIIRYEDLTNKTRADRDIANANAETLATTLADRTEQITDLRTALATVEKAFELVLQKWDEATRKPRGRIDGLASGIVVHQMNGTEPGMSPEAVQRAAAERIQGVLR